MLIKSRIEGICLENNLRDIFKIWQRKDVKIHAVNAQNNPNLNEKFD
jgi:hypothetical protein